MYSKSSAKKWHSLILKSISNTKISPKMGIWTEHNSLWWYTNQANLYGHLNGKYEFCVYLDVYRSLSHQKIIYLISCTMSIKIELLLRMTENRTFSLGGTPKFGRLIVYAILQIETWYASLNGNASIHQFAQPWWWWWFAGSLYFFFSIDFNPRFFQ